MGNGPQTESLEERLQRAIDFKNDGRYEEAMTAFRSILAETPKCVPARLGLGLSLCFIGEFDASLEELKRAVQDGPECVDTHLNLGKTYAMLGMYEEAKEEFKQVLLLCPNHKEATRQLTFFNNPSEA